MYLVKVDSSGIKEWEKVYVFSYESTDIGFGIAKTYDGGYIITGYASLIGENRYLWLLRTDSEGDTLWTEVMGGGLGDGGFDVVETPDHGYIIAGYTSSYSSNPGVQADGWLVKTNSSGDTVWTNSFPGNNGVGGAFYSVQNTPDGGYILGGWDDANQWDGWMLKTDGTGNVLWSDSWGDITGQGWDHILCAQPTPDGGCIGFGASYTYSTPSYDGWMIKIDSLPVGVEEKKAVPISDSPIMFSVEPNPFRDKTEIKWTLGTGHSALGENPITNDQCPMTISIYDVGGRLVKSFSLFTPHSSLISSLSWDGKDNKGKRVKPGIYFIKIVGATSGLQPITKKVVVIR